MLPQQPVCPNMKSAATWFLRSVRSISLLVFSLFTLILPASWSGPVFAQASTALTTRTQPAEVSAETTVLIQTVLLDPAGKGSPEVDGKAYVLYDAQSGTFLLGKNPDMPLAPASITKVMTALLALENLQLTDLITITPDMFESIPNDYTRLGLVEGEVISVEDALHACLIISANDAAMALAITMGGSVDKFSDMMNARAVELGCTNTHFTNPYGYADEAHLTTAHDMALMTAEALKHAVYTEISTKKHHMLPPTNLYSESRGLPNGNRFVAVEEYAYDPYIGGKTGYTRLSRYTIVAGARQEDRTLIGVILSASNSPIRYANLIDLFDYGFSAYVTEPVDPAEYEVLKDPAADRVTAQIEQAGYALAIAQIEMHLETCTTVSSARQAGGHIARIDLNQADVLADRPSQVLLFPLYRQYADGTQIQVGSLEITVQERKTPETTAATETEPAAEPVSDKAGTTFAQVLRYGLVILLAAGLVFCILLLIAMLRRDINRRRRSRKPRIF